MMILYIISCSIYTIAQTDYYYYNGTKIPLTLNENKVCVSTYKDNKDVSERILANVQVLETINYGFYEAFNIIVISKSDFEKLTSQDFWEEDAKSVILTSCYLTENNEDLYSTPFLAVRLKKEEDIDLLASYAEKYKLKIVGNNQFMPSWYYLSVTLESEKSPLECANELYETGNVGFGKLHEGDTIFHWIESNGMGNGDYTVRPGDPRIGETYWIYKNSYGTDLDSALNGYMHVIHYNYSNSVGFTYYCMPPVTTMNYADSDIIISDADGDGLYFWGLGDKPAHCPSWVPDTPDGDDSNINYGSIDEYGNLDVLPAGYTIKDPLTYSLNNSISYRLGIVDGGIYTITGTMTMIGDSKIRVCEGGVLIVDGGTIQNADITMVPGCTVIIRNNGKINMALGKTFEAPLGATVTIESGEIN